MIARGCEKLALQTAALRGNPEVLNDLCALVDGLLVHASPEVEDYTEAKHETSMASSGGARMDGAEAALNLCRIDSRTAERFAPALERLSRDPHPEVRLAIAHALALLRNTAPEAMWRIAAIYARDEPNRRVLRFFADFLSRVIHTDPPRVEELVLAILPRAQSNRDKPGQELMEVFGSLIIRLSVSH